MNSEITMNFNHLDYITDNILENKEEQHGNVKNNNTYENHFTDSNLSSNHDDRSATHKAAKREPITNRNLLFCDDYTDNINTVSENAKLRKNNTINSDDNFHFRTCGTNYVACSKKMHNNPVIHQSNIQKAHSSLLRDSNYSKTSVDAKTCADKETYCRPVYNFYNQEFVYRNMSNKARLQQLIRKIVYARQREKRQQRWNNFISELKNKHKCAGNAHRNIKSPITLDRLSPDVIDDSYNTTYCWRQSNQCQNLLDDFYGASGSIDPYSLYKSYEYNDRPQISNYKPCVYESRPYCYPTSSQGHLQMCNREMGIKHLNNNWPSRRYFHGNTIVVDSDCSLGSTGRRHSNQSRPIKYPLLRVNKRVILKNSAIQTELNAIVSEESLIDDIKEETIKQKCERVSKNIDRLKKKIGKSHNNVQQSQTLTNVESKLNDLIQSINDCLLEIKTNSEFKRRIVCDMTHNVSKTTFAFENIETKRKNLNKTCISQFDDILCEELAKSNRVKRSVEDIINRHSDRTCGVQITFDIPTRERATEVTASLSKARFNVDKMVVVEEINNPKSERMTIAVNTDPLGLLALLKVSTETLKRILSYMPQIDYYAYLPMIQFPQYSRDGGVSHYVCSVCGMAFGRPSQLSDHIQEHNLGKSRDCCICRHMLDVPRHRVELFPCRYCGQRFTRAYCCQLHEDSCAKRLGVRHDVTSNLTLLR